MKKLLTQEENSQISKLSEEQYIHQKMQGKDFWHYTSIGGVLGIFDYYIKNECNKDVAFVSECSMLASNIRFLNDAKEFDDGAQIYESETDKLDGDTIFKYDDIFLISFCEKGDLLSQWKWYGKKSGISVCFNPEKITYKKFSYIDDKGEELKICNKNGESSVKEFYDDYISPIKIHYSLKEKKSYLNELRASSIGSNSLSNSVLKLLFVPYCKDEGFAEEKESRLTFFKYKVPEYNGYHANFDIKYNISYDNKVKPALSVKMKYKNKENQRFFSDNESPNIISKIIVGPGIDQENIFNTLIHIFDRNNFCYHDQNEDISTEKEPIDFNDFNEKDKYLDGNLHKIKYYGKIHIAYKCKNNIIIMKSSIPFRG